MTELASRAVELPMAPAPAAPSPSVELPMAPPTPGIVPVAAPPASPVTGDPPRAESHDIEGLARRLDEAESRMAELDPFPRRILKDHLEALDELNRAGLTAIVRSLREDPRGKELLFELVEEPIVRMLLSMHGIIRTSDPVALAEKVLQSIRPGIATHGGDVQLSHIAEGVAYVRLSGACNGCSMAAVTMRNGVEKALVDGVASITAVEVLPNDPEPPPLLQITTAGGVSSQTNRKPDALHAGWFKTLPVERIAEGTLEALSLTPTDGESVEVVVVNAAGKLAAYVNACAHQGMPLDNALVDAVEGTITCPWHGFCFDSTNGECLTMPGAQLEQLPLRVDEGHIWVRARS